MKDEDEGNVNLILSMLDGTVPNESSNAILSKS
jgi:hypothetical protein